MRKTIRMSETSVSRFKAKHENLLDWRLGCMAKHLLLVTRFHSPCQKLEIYRRENSL